MATSIPMQSCPYESFVRVRLGKWVARSLKNVAQAPDTSGHFHRLRVHAVVHTAVMALWEVRAGRPFPTNEQWRELEISGDEVLGWFQAFHVSMIAYAGVSPEQWNIPDAFCEAHRDKTRLSDGELDQIRKLMADPLHHAEMTAKVLATITPEHLSAAKLN